MLAKKRLKKLLKDRYTLIERSNTVIEQSGHFKFTICSQYHGFNCMIIYNSGDSSIVGLAVFIIVCDAF